MRILKKNLSENDEKKQIFFKTSGVKLRVIFEAMIKIVWVKPGYTSGTFEFTILCLIVLQTHISNDNVLKFQLCHPVNDDELMMMSCFCGMVDRRKALSLISSRDHCQRSSPSRISDTPQTGFEPAQNLSSGFE